LLTVETGNERQDYWYRRRYSNKYRPKPIPDTVLV